MAIKEPYNRIAKDKVTLSLASLLCEANNGRNEGLGTGFLLVQPLENQVDRNNEGVKAAAMKSRPNTPQSYWLSLG